MEWSQEDEVYIGKCPDLMTGIHGYDPNKLHEDLLQVVDEIIGEYHRNGRTLPKPKVKPMQEVG